MTASLARKELASLVEYTCRDADVTRDVIENICAQARAEECFSVCVNGLWVAQAVVFLDDSPVKVTSAVAFPLGASDADVKRYETEVAVDHGAHFIEVVANIGRLKGGDYAYVRRELLDLVEAADERPVSLYHDLALLTPDDLRRSTELAVEVGILGITTCGSFDSGPPVEALKIVREKAGDRLGIKVEWGFRDASDLAELVNAGATRFGLVNDLSLLRAL